jgi:group II intron reverse transcriptase/maturase
MSETQCSSTICTKLERIAKLAKDRRDEALTTLAHHIDVDWMREAYRRTRKDGAKGVDGRSAKEFAANLEGNLQSLLERAKSGAYRAPPVRRVHIPKGDGRGKRPIGIPTFEDKVLQRAVAMVLEAVYEQDFCDCSYGFRPRRSAHQALEALQNATMRMAGGWVLEVDIKSFFDTLDHAHLREILRRRVRDGVLLRLIGKWLKAGVLDGVELSHPEAGTPQGGVISPLLANIYLHEVLDEWFVNDVLPRLRSRATLVRYADDFVVVFSRKLDAERVLAVLPKRFGKYGLTLHPDKTQLVPFRRPDLAAPRGEPEPRTFDLLGFTHYWGLSRKGKWIVMKQTAKGRLSRSLRRIRGCASHPRLEGGVDRAGSCSASWRWRRYRAARRCASIIPFRVPAWNVRMGAPTPPVVAVHRLDSSDPASPASPASPREPRRVCAGCCASATYIRPPSRSRNRAC